MYFTYQGEIFALSTALCWAYAVILFRKSGYHISPISLNLFKNTVAVILLIPTMLIFKVPITGQASGYDTLILLISGVLGIALADTLFFRSLNILGASLSAVVDCLYSPFTVFFAFIFIGERIKLWDYIGAAFIVGAVLMTSEIAKATELSRKDIIRGIVYGAVSMVLMAFGIVLAKPIIDKTPVLWSSTVRLLGGSAALMLITFLRPSPSKIWSVFKPAEHWKVSIPATVMGAYLSMIVWIAGMKFTKVSIAAVLNQMSTIFIVILAFFLLKESLTLKKIAAVALAVGGALLVILA